MKKNHIPKELYYNNAHVWLGMESESNFIMGLTEFGQLKLGDIEHIELPEIGDELYAGDESVVLEGALGVVSLELPISGTITAVNDMLLEAPGLINQHPYDDGWLVKIQASDVDELDELMSPSLYAEFLEEEEEL